MLKSSAHDKRQLKAKTILTGELMGRFTQISKIHIFQPTLTHIKPAHFICWHFKASPQHNRGEISWLWHSKHPKIWFKKLNRACDSFLFYNSYLASVNAHIYSSTDKIPKKCPYLAVKTYELATSRKPMGQIRNRLPVVAFQWFAGGKSVCISCVFTQQLCSSEISESRSDNSMAVIC